MKRLAAVLALFALANAARAADEAAILAAEPPALLSQYGFFADLATLAPAQGVVAYDLATPLYSDGALKSRAVYLPPGRAASWRDDEALAFPVGSALIKTFAFPADFREPERNLRRIETRVLLHQEDGWKAHAYVWRDDLSDAELKVAGKRIAVEFVDADGGKVEFEYAVPNRNQCKGCHDIGGAIAPIGPKARNLHFAVRGGRSQLVLWQESGILVGGPDLTRVTAAVNAFDRQAGANERARAWLDVNCAHCHREAGPASNSGLNLDRGETDRVKLGIGKRPVAAGRGTGNREFDIVPGQPERSILMLRVESAEPGVMMPELGRALVDEQGAALIREWIVGLR